MTYAMGDYMHEHLVAGHAARGTVGEVALLDGGPRTHHAWAESDATLAHVPLPAVTHWLAEHPDHWRHIGQLAVHKLRVVFAAIEDTSLYPPRERLIRCLVSLARGYGQREGASRQTTLRVSQERLGSARCCRSAVKPSMRCCSASNRNNCWSV